MTDDRRRVIERELEIIRNHPDIDREYETQLLKELAQLNSSA